MRNKLGDRSLWSVFREEGEGYQVWLSSQSAQHFSPFSWDQRCNSAAVWYVVSGHTHRLWALTPVLLPWQPHPGNLPDRPGPGLLAFPTAGLQAWPRTTSHWRTSWAAHPLAWPWDSWREWGWCQSNGQLNDGRGIDVRAGPMGPPHQTLAWWLSMVSTPWAPWSRRQWPTCCPRRKSAAPQFTLSKLNSPNLYPLLKLRVTCVPHSPFGFPCKGRMLICLFFRCSEDDSHFSSGDRYKQGLLHRESGQGREENGSDYVCVQSQCADPMDF